MKYYHEELLRGIVDTGVGYTFKKLYRSQTLSLPKLVVCKVTMIDENQTITLGSDYFISRTNLYNIKNSIHLCRKV